MVFWEGRILGKVGQQGNWKHVVLPSSWVLVSYSASVTFSCCLLSVLSQPGHLLLSLCFPACLDQLPAGLQSCQTEEAPPKEEGVHPGWEGNAAAWPY